MSHPLHKNAITVAPASDSDRGAWNGFLASRDRQLPMADFEWAAVLWKAYGIESRLFMARDSHGRVVGVLPTYIVHGLWRDWKLFSLRCGLVADHPAVAAKLLTAARDCALLHRAAEAIATSGTAAFDVPFRIWTKSTVELQISDNIEAVWRGLRDKTRNMIRKGERHHLVLSRDPSYLKAFYRYYAARLASKGVSLHKLRFFEELASALGGRFELYTALRDGEPVAGLIFLRGQGAASYFQSAFLPSASNLGATYFLMWHAIKTCVSQKVAFVDLGEATPGGGVYQFKTLLGGLPRAVYYYDLLGKPGLETANGGTDAVAGDHPEPSTERPSRLSRIARWLPSGLSVPLLVWAKAHGRLV